MNWLQHISRQVRKQRRKMANKYIGDYAAITTLQSGDEIVINQAIIDAISKSTKLGKEVEINIPEV